MTPAQIRGAARPILYSNPFWSDPVDAAADPVISAAAQEIIEWQPVREQRFRTAIGIYIALWVVELGLLVGLFSSQTDEEGEAWGWPAGLLLAALFLVIPAILAGWTSPPRTRVMKAVAIIRSGSAQRYQAWLSWLQQNDPVAHGQVVLWHQGNQANQLATAQLATQLYTAYQVTQTRNEIRRHQ